jgi:hypothetical protein
MRTIPIAILILIFIFAGIPNISAEIIVYDNITTMQYKTIQQSSDLCMGTITDCKNEMYFDGFLVQTYKDGELLQYTDNTNITLNLEDPINTNVGSIYTVGKNKLQVGVMYFAGIIVVIIILLVIVYSIKGSRKKGWF